MINLRFGFFTLLATSLINAVYQHSNSGVVSIALALAGVSLVFLGATFLPSVKTLLRNRLTVIVLWVLISSGIVLNVLV